MPAYTATIRRPLRTLTEFEQATLLKVTVTGEHRAGFRDHVIFAVALGTGLRQHEIAARGEPLAPDIDQWRCAPLDEGTASLPA